MDDLYNKISLLCEQANINVTKMCKDAGVSRGALSDLKIGRTKTLSSSTLQKIATYFNISVDYFLGVNNEEQKEDGVKTPSSENNISPSLQKLYEIASELSEEQIQDVLDYIQFKKYKQEKDNKQPIKSNSNSK